MADTQPPKSKRRGFETAGDMVRSMVLILVPVLLIAWFFLPHGDDDPLAIDPTVDIQSTARSVDFEVYAPAALSDDWVPTSSMLIRPAGAASTDQPIGLSIGYVTPDEQFARYTQQTGERDAVLRSSLTGADVVADPDGEDVTLDGRVWTPVSTTKGSAVITVEGAGPDAVVLVIAGTASRSELLELAGSLQPVSA